VLLLALDTSGTGVGVAVHDGASVVAEVSVPGAQKHAEQLMPAVVAALGRAGVDRFALTDLVVGVGPGPFTGLRVGLVTAQVLGLTLALPVHGVCSLDAIAEVVAADVMSAGGGVGGDGTESFLVATDARRREVYWARYEVTTGPWPWRRLEGPFVAVPAEVPVVGPDGVRRRVVGRGVELYPELLAVVVEAAAAAAASTTTASSSG